MSEQVEWRINELNARLTKLEKRVEQLESNRTYTGLVSHRQSTRVATVLVYVIVGYIALSVLNTALSFSMEALGLGAIVPVKVVSIGASLIILLIVSSRR